MSVALVVLVLSVAWVSLVMVVVWVVWVVCVVSGVLVVLVVSVVILVSVVSDVLVVLVETVWWCWSCCSPSEREQEFLIRRRHRFLTCPLQVPDSHFGVPNSIAASSRLAPSGSRDRVPDSPLTRSSRRQAGQV